MRTCYGKRDKSRIGKVYKRIMDEDLSLPEKVLEIDKLNVDITPPVFIEARNSYTLAMKESGEKQIIELNQKEKNYAVAEAIERGYKGKKFKPVTHGLVLDGEAYTVIHAEKMMRVIRSRDNELILKKPVPSPMDMNERKKAIPAPLSNRLSKRFANKEMYPSDGRNLSQEIVETNRQKYPIEEDGLVPIGRKIIKAKENAGLFGLVPKAFTNLSRLQGMDRKNQIDASPEYIAGIENIKNYIPKGIRDIIMNDDDVEGQIEFYEGFDHFLNVFSDMKVSTEEVWNQNWKLDSTGKLVQVKHSKFESPNYLSYLGKFETEETNIENPVEGKPTPEKVKTSEKLKLHAGIEEIIKFYSVKAMTDMHELESELQGKTYEDIAKLIGVSSNVAIKLKEDFIDRGQLPASSFIRDAAKDAYSQMGISTDASMDMNIKNGIIASLDAAIRATLINSGYVTYHNAEADRKAISDSYREANDYENASNSVKKEVDKAVGEEWKKINSHYDFDGKYLSMFELNLGESFGENKEHQKVFSTVNKLKYLNASENRRVISLTSFKETQDQIKNKTYSINPDMNLFRNQQNQVKWRYKQDFEDVYQAYQKSVIKTGDSEEVKVEKTLAREELYESLGKEKIDENTHITEVKVIQANNDSIERHLGVLVSSYMTAKGKDFFIPWAEVASGRMMIQSDMNPQESKLIRSLIEMHPEDQAKYAGHAYKMTNADLNGRSKKKLNMLEMAMSQAFDMDPDKNSKATVLKEIRELVDITGEGIVINDSTDLGKALKAVVIDRVTGSKYAKAMNTIFDKGEGHHALQGARMLKRLNVWKKRDEKYRKANPFNNDLTIETDAITSGMMLTLMQIMDADSIVMLAKGGIFTDQTEQQWSKYTKKWLKIKYRVNGTNQKQIPFGPASLIEAGNFHQEVKEKAEKNEGNEGLTLKEIDDAQKEEVYQDLYKTIGLEMKGTVDARKAEIKDRLFVLNSYMEWVKGQKNVRELTQQESETLKSYEKEADRLNVQDAMLEVIGEINPKVLRKIAKDPVMVFIYGSTITSIRKKLGVSVGRKNFIESIKTAHKYEGRTDLDTKEQAKNDKAVAFVEAVIQGYHRQTEFARGYNELDITKDMKYKALSEKNKIYEYDMSIPSEKNNSMTRYEMFMQLDIDEDLTQVLNNAVNDTFGDAIEEAFDKRTGSVEKYRNMMKSSELFLFELFRAKTETYKRNATKDGVWSKVKFDAMMKELEEAGFGHDLATGDGRITDRRLPLYNQEDTGSNGQGSATLTFDKSEIFDDKGNLRDKEYSQQTRMYAYLHSKEFRSNTGATATISIHQMDSRAITITIEGNAWLSIYDAVVQASHPDNVEYTNDTYNGKIFEQNSQRNILGDNVRKITYMFEDLEKRIANGDKDAIREKQEIKDRLSSSEPVKYDLSTYSAKNIHTGLVSKQKVVMHDLKINSEDHTATIELSEDHHKTSYVDVFSKTYANGNQTVKEVYWINDTKKKSRVDSKILNRTVVKTIIGDKMHVVEMHKRDIRKDEYKKNKNGEYLLNKEGKKIRGGRDYTAYKIEYTIEGENEIKEHNSFKHNGVYKLEAETPFGPIEVSTVDVNLEDNNGELLNIITNEKEAELTTVSTDRGSLVPEKGTSYEPTLSGQDFKSESKRLFLPIEAIVSNLDAVHPFLQVRNQNLKNFKFHIAHAAISDTKAVKVGSLESGVEDQVYVDAMTEFLTDIRRDNFVNDKKYLVQHVTELFSTMSEDNDEKHYEFIVNNGINVAYGKKTEALMLGGEKDGQVAKIFDDIALYNRGYYTDKSVVTVLPSGGKYAIGLNGKPVGQYKDIDKAIKAMAEFTTESVNESLVASLNEMSVTGTTNSDAITILLKSQNKEIKKITPEMKNDISKYQIQSYLKSKGYEETIAKIGDERVSTWKPKKLGYNKSIKNNIEYFNLANEIFNCK